MQEEATYFCSSCGEEIVVPIDLSAGSSQEYAEDCPVCCHANVIHVEVNERGEARAWAENESG
jgi:Cysteine-rich CPXCG